MRFIPACLLAALSIAARASPIGTGPPLKIVIPSTSHHITPSSATSEEWVHAGGSASNSAGVESMSTSATLLPEGSTGQSPSHSPQHALTPLHRAPTIGNEPGTSEVHHESDKPYWEQYPTRNHAKLRTSTFKNLGTQQYLLHMIHQFYETPELEYLLAGLDSVHQRCRKAKHSCVVLLTVAPDGFDSPLLDDGEKNHANFDQDTKDPKISFHKDVKYDEVVEKVRELTKDGIHVVATVGSDDIEERHPLADVPEVIIVGGVDPRATDEPDVYRSNFGNYIDVWGISTKIYAPISGILFQFLNVRLKEGLKAIDGAVAAAAQAAGVLASEISASRIKPSPLVAKKDFLAKSQMHRIYESVHRHTIKNAKLLHIPPEVSGVDDLQYAEHFVYDLRKTAVENGEATLLPSNKSRPARNEKFFAGFDSSGSVYTEGD
ncbi:hypothetical protein H0H93_008949 [Arthromyces matolae]|nr:hypothetical protein H0H93_008949 [Arthromyces matolae]